MNLISNRWAILAAAVTVCLVFGILYSFSIFTLPLEHDFGWTRVQSTMTFSLALIFTSLGMLASGGVIARIGPRATAALGGCLLAAGFFLASFTASLPWLYFTYGVMGGLGIGLANMPPLAVALRWFPDKKGLATGLITMALAIGTLVLGSGLAAGWVVDYGWSGAFRILSLVFLAVVVGGSLFFRFPPEGYLPKDWTPPEDHSRELWGYNRINMLKTGACWMITLWIIGISFGALMVISSVVPLAVEKGVPLAAATMGMGVYAISNGLGRMLFAWLHDWAGRKAALLLNALAMGTGLLGLIFLFDLFGYPGLIVSLIFIGAAYGGNVPQAALLTDSFFGPKHFPKNYGLFTIPAGIVSSFAGPFVGSLLRESTGAYIPGIMVAAAITVLSVVVSLSIKPPARRTD